jgi:hypothetical protein
MRLFIYWFGAAWGGIAGSRPSAPLAQLDAAGWVVDASPVVVDVVVPPIFFVMLAGRDTWSLEVEADRVDAHALNAAPADKHATAATTLVKPWRRLRRLLVNVPNVRPECAPSCAG